MIHWINKKAGPSVATRSEKIFIKNLSMLQSKKRSSWERDIHAANHCTQKMEISVSLFPNFDLKASARKSTDAQSKVVFVCLVSEFDKYIKKIYCIVYMNYFCMINQEIRRTV